MAVKGSACASVELFLGVGTHIIVSRLKCVHEDNQDGLTQSESYAEGDVSDGVDAAVDGGVPDVHQVAQFRHHGAVYHTDGKAEAGIRHY